MHTETRVLGKAWHWLFNNGVEWKSTYKLCILFSKPEKCFWFFFCFYWRYGLVSILYLGSSRKNTLKRKGAVNLKKWLVMQFTCSYMYSSNHIGNIKYTYGLKIITKYINLYFVRYVYIRGKFWDKICSFVFSFLPATFCLHHKIYIKIQDFWVDMYISRYVLN